MVKAGHDFIFQTCGILLLGVAVGCRPAGQATVKLPPEVTSFAARKEAQAKELAKQFNVEVSSDIWRYFDASKKGDFAKSDRLFEKLKKRAGQYAVSKGDPANRSEVWQTVLETVLACEAFGLGEPVYAREFGQEIINSIPAGSIYFGGTDPGRGLVTLLCKSQETGDPFFTVTQNALVDNHYLNYLKAIYGDRIYTPNAEDSQAAFNEYLQDAQKRLESGELKPGEDVKIVNNRVQVSGQVAVMTINGLLAKVIFENNTNREFFIEESFALDWMYPHLAPHGLIMKIYREPLSTIEAQEVEKDQKFWAERIKPMVGDWLKADTSVKEVCDFAERVYARKDLRNFRGDPKYVVNTNATGMFSKLRSSIGGVYAWRAKHASDSGEKKRMAGAADLAFRQAYALYPASSEAVFRYVDFLKEESRSPEALQVAETALRVVGGNKRLKDLVGRLRAAEK